MLHINFVVCDVNQYMMKHTSLNMKPSWLTWIGYTTATRLVTILTNDAIKHTCIWPLVWYVTLQVVPWHNWSPGPSTANVVAVDDPPGPTMAAMDGPLYRLFSDFSPFCSPVKVKGKQWRMKGLTMTQWINLNRNNRSLLVYRYFLYWEKKLALSSYR